MKRAKTKSNSITKRGIIKLLSPRGCFAQHFLDSECDDAFALVKCKHYRGENSYHGQLNPRIVKQLQARRLLVTAPELYCGDYILASVCRRSTRIQYVNSEISRMSRLLRIKLRWRVQPRLNHFPEQGAFYLEGDNTKEVLPTHETAGDRA